MDDFFEVTGHGGSVDTIPPVTTCTLEGTLDGDIYTSDVTVTFSATDAQSGVNYTNINSMMDLDCFLRDPLM